MYVSIEWLGDNGYLSAEENSKITDAEKTMLITEAQTWIEKLTGHIFERRAFSKTLKLGRDWYAFQNPIIEVSTISDTSVTYTFYNDTLLDSYRITFDREITKDITINGYEGILENNDTPALIKRCLGLLVILIKDDRLTEGLTKSYILEEKADVHTIEYNANGGAIFNDGEIDRILWMYRKRHILSFTTAQGMV